MSTLSKQTCPDYAIEPSEMSKQGMSFVMANGEEVPNDGQQTLPTFSENLVRTTQKWQVAEISKPLLSVGEECDLNQWVVFTSRGGGSSTTP